MLKLCHMLVDGLLNRRLDRWLDRWLDRMYITSYVIPFLHTQSCTMSDSHSRYGVHIPGVPEFLRQCSSHRGESSSLHKSQEETGGIPSLWKPAGKKQYSRLWAGIFPDPNSPCSTPPSVLQLMESGQRRLALFPDLPTDQFLITCLGTKLIMVSWDWHDLPWAMIILGTKFHNTHFNF